MQVPTPTIVSWFPVTVQMLAALLVLKVKVVRPLEAVAASVIGDTPTVTGDAGVNVTVWLINMTGTSAVTGRRAGTLARLASWPLPLNPQHTTPAFTVAQP